MATIEIQGKFHSISVTAEEGSNLLQILRQNNFAVPAVCGGNGTCGKCKVKISNDSKRTFKEVLSCRTEVTDGMVVEVDENDLSTYSESRKLQEDTVPDPSYGVAVDLGTTTITANLVDLTSGEVFSSITEWNCQIPYGADVISRIHYIMQHENGLEMLSQKIRNQIDEMIQKLLKSANSQGLYSNSDHNKSLWENTLLSGNTVMQHIYAGIDPSPMAAAPYIPDSLFEDTSSFMPCISGFIGGDITSGLFDQEMYKKDGVCLFLDIGTNGEMVIGGKDGLFAASVATGPAFEGAQIACGCYGRAGALSHISWNPFLLKFDMEVIEGDQTSMNGICGSGLIDLLAALLDLGLITKEGRIISPSELEEILDEDTLGAMEDQLYMDFFREDQDLNGVFYLTDHIYLNTSDVRNLQLAKAAVRTGIELLTQKMNIKPEDIDEVILAGGFGSHLNLTNLAKIGMLPEALINKVTFAGNTSLHGATKALCEPDSREKLLKIQNMCKYMELADAEAFAETFIKYISF